LADSGAVPVADAAVQVGSIQHSFSGFNLKLIEGEVYRLRFQFATNTRHIDLLRAKLDGFDPLRYFDQQDEVEARAAARR